MTPGELDSVQQAAELHRLAKVPMWAGALLPPSVLIWVSSGIPPAFLPGWVRWAVGIWMLLSVLGTVVVVTTRREAGVHREASHPEGGPWSLEPRRRLVALCSLAGVVLLGGMTFVIDTRVPAAVLGPVPARAVIESREYVDASRRGDVDRARVTFVAEGVTVSTWVVDPYTTLARTPEVVYDPDHTERVMAIEAWRGARATLWLLPTALLLTIGCALVPVTVRWRGRSRFGALRPGTPISAVSRPGRAKVLKVTWQDGQSATFLDVRGLSAEIARRVHAEGAKVALPTGMEPWLAERPAPSD